MNKDISKPTDMVIKIAELMTFVQEHEQNEENILEILQRLLDLINILDDVEKTYYLNDITPPIVIPSRNMPHSNGLDECAQEILDVWNKLKKENKELEFRAFKEIIQKSNKLSNTCFDNINPEKIYVTEAAGRSKEHDLFIIEKKSDAEISEYEKEYVRKVSICSKLINESIFAGKLHLQNEKIFTQVLDNIDSMIYVSDLETEEVLFVNNSMRKTFGLKDIKNKVCWQVFQEGFTNTCEFCPVHKLKSVDDAPIIWEEHNTVTGKYYQNTDRLINWIDGRVVHIQHSMDITDLKNAEEDLKSARDIAEQNAQAKSEFLSKMSHELRTPLNAIIGMINIIEKSGDIQKIKSSVYKMKTASQNLLQNINDILDISKIEAGKMEMLNTQFNIEKMFRNIFDIIEFAAHEKEIDIEIKISDSIHNCFNGDVKRLSQVYMNLLSNAVKFTEKGGKISVLVNYEKTRDGKIELISSVTDTGVGIPSDKINKLFGSFVQVDNSLSRQYSGTGLGLVIAKNIVELMGGKINVKSELGVGTEFTFNILLEPSQEQEEIKVSPEIFNILVIDDSDETCEYLHDLFSTRDIKHKVAKSGAEGVKLAKEEIKNGDGFNVILVDYIMPNMDGIETIEKLHNIVPSDTIIIMISSIDWVQIEDKAKEVGINTFLPKPLLPSDIINSINEIFKKKTISHVKEEQESFDFSGKTILLLEDVDVNREIMQFLLEDTGAKCIEAVDGIEGVSLYNQEPEKYDLILMDIQMPNMDGFEATKQIRESGKPNAKTIPIIAMTANVFAEQIEDTLNAGMNSHLGKPVDELELKKELAKYLNI